MPNPPVDLSVLAAMVQQQTDQMATLLDQFIAMITSNQNTVVVNDAEGNEVTVPTWSAISGTNAGQISSLISQVATLQGTVNSAASAITSLQNSRTTDESNIAANTGTITTLSTTLTSVQATLNTLSSTITGIQSNQAADETDIGTLTDAMTAAQGAITTLQGQASTLLTAVAQLQTSTAALATKGDTAITTDGSAQFTGFVALGKLALLTKLSTDVGCRVRLYATAATRDADLARLPTTPPTVDLGVLFEGSTSGGTLSYLIGPSCMLHNADSPQSNKVYYTVEPADGTSVVHATLTSWQIQA